MLLKLSILLGTTAYAIPVDFDPTAIRISCNEAALTPSTPLHIPEIDTTDFDVTVLLDPLGDIGLNETVDDVGKGRMCVFSRWTKSLEDKAKGEGSYFPLGRAVSGIKGYAGYDGVAGDWNRPPGKSASLNYVCGEANNTGSNFDLGEYLCEVTLPMTSTPNKKNVILMDLLDPPYYLTYYERARNVRNEISRFLHLTTFGPTSAELDELEAAYSTLYGNEPDGSDPTALELFEPLMTHEEAMEKLQVEWVAAQMDPSNFSSGKFSSLREYWRKRLNPRRWETYRIGEAGPAPCELHSRWRKFAFTDYDVQNSRSLRWGNVELGSSYQTQVGHRVTVETIELAGVPSASPSVSFEPTLSAMPTPLPTSASPTGSTVESLTGKPTISMAPTAHNIIGFGDMENATDAQILNAWPGRVPTNVIRLDDTIDPSLDPNAPFVHSGSASLEVVGGRGFIMRQIGGDCPTSRLSEPILAGDVLRITLYVNMKAANKVITLYTGHYHTSKPKLWAIQPDNSNIISRTRINKANTWTRIEAIHTVGDDWTWDSELLPPEKCNHYQLRIKADGTTAGFYLDDFRIEKVASGSEFALTARDVRHGFLKNPDFAMSFQYWKSISSSGDTVFDADQGKEVARLKRGRRLMQNILNEAIPGDKYQVAFWAKLSGTPSVNTNIIVRMRFENDDLVNGPCRRSICNIFLRPLTTTIKSNGRQWQRIVTEEFTMFGNYTQWPGQPSFILFTMLTKDMESTGELRVSNFEFMGDHSLTGEVYTSAPSTSVVPSMQPSNLRAPPHIAYVVRYAGDIRTIIDYPFQVDSTGEVLAMDGSKQYQLCEVDEVEGKYGIFPNRMGFLLGGRCQLIRHGNPTVHLDPIFVNMTDIHLLDLSDDTTTTVTPINVEQTYGGDLLLESVVEDEICETFPNPYDNDYRGADKNNPEDVPSRFDPDKPVFAVLPDGSYALYDSRLVTAENTLENPTPDGGGASVLRSTIRAQRDGFTSQVAVTGRMEFYVFNDHNIALCNNEQPNFLNRDNCVLTYDENACVKEYDQSTNTFIDVQLVITFDEETLAQLHNTTRASVREASPGVSARDNSRYIYSVTNLRYDDSIANGTKAGTFIDLPCYRVGKSGNPTSRWIPRPDLDNSTCTNTLQDSTVSALKHILETSNDMNPYIRDVILWNAMEEDSCHEADLYSFGMLIMTSEGCWENVHPDYMNIIDFTDYVAAHPVSTTPDTSITGFKDIGFLEFPDSHPMSYFEDLKKEEGTLIRSVARYVYSTTSRVNQNARYGDRMIVDQFGHMVGISHDRLNLMAVADQLGTMMLSNQVESNRGGGTLVCGSPNEVAPDPTLDDYFDALEADRACIGCQMSYVNYYQQKQTVWTINALEAEDQLCQRNAWALYEHLNVGITTAPDNTETNLYTYDILTRNCFGTYFDVLKEMVYSPKIGEQFNSVGSASARLKWDVHRQLVLPDENLGREIMQLFTIGMHELNYDGTETLDEFNRPIQTYDNYDIMTNARILTGFVYTARRGNVEELFRSNKSRMDPMRLEIDSHDFFPKASVDGNWIGDRYPLCVDLPSRHFLKMGATFRFRGGSTLPQSQFVPPHWDSDESIRRFVLSPESSLYTKLCNPSESGECQYANTVTLDENIECFGRECRVDDVIIIQVNTGAFYEYVRQPCVQLSFYENAKKVVTGYSAHIPGVGRRHTHAMCLHPKKAAAARACCDVTEADVSEYNYKMEYHGERTLFETTELQCAADGGRVCDGKKLIADNPAVNIRTTYDNIYPSQNLMFWTDSSCSLLLKVRADGLVALIHQPAKNSFFDDVTVPYVDVNNTITFIRVPWAKDEMTAEEIYPTVNNTCGAGACSITHDNACLCEVTVTEGAVFDSLPSREDVLSLLKVGALPPDTFAGDAVTYSLLESTPEVEVYVASDASGIGAESTIFQVQDEFGKTLYMKNFGSNITIGGLYTMRNFPNFIEVAAPELRDAEYEIDAFIMSLIQHPSAPPFNAKNLLQLYGFSNPTPGQVDRVARAFKQGFFFKGDQVFGDGRYGNLAAVTAAIVLDSESVSPVLDEDPIHGQVREPLLKVIGVMRSLNFKRHPSVKLRHPFFDNLRYKIGQQVFEPPDQFGFFAQDYQPPGSLADAGLYSPESELLSMNAIVGMTNGFFSLYNFGLTTGFGGFGPYLKGNFEVGDTSSAVGYLSYEPSASDLASKIDEYSTLLMAGRLSDENKQIIFDAYTSFNATNGTEVAERVMMKLLTSTPEFHSSNTLRKTGAPRPVTPPPEKSSSPYQAIVYINLFGGMDSFNMLTPYKSGGCTLYDDYFEARGGKNGIGLRMDQILPIDASTAGIPGCETFGVNNMLTAFKEIYDEGKGIFLANMGHLHKPVTKANWMTETRTDLFSHHTMKKESHEVDAFKEGEGPGVMGRMLDVLERNGEAVSATAVNVRATMVDGSPKTGRLPDVISSDGLHKIYDNNWLSGKSQELRGILESLHSETDENSGFFQDKFSQSFIDIWNKTDALVESIRGVKTVTTFSTRLDMAGISSSLKQVSRLIQIRNERGDGINKDVFHVQQGGYDGHFDLDANLKTRFPSLNLAVGGFWAEMKAQGMQDQVTVLIGSEFGRTINPNSNLGSDHAWAGNYFMFGGSVKGGRILGKYPTSFGDSYPYNIGQGRLIPTHSWDSVWYGISQWFGIKDLDDLDYVLPNSANFGCDLFTDSDLFITGTEVLKGCGGGTQMSPVTMQIPEPRYLTGEEQKSVCRVAVRAMGVKMKFAPSNSRCYVAEQAIVPSELAPGFFDINGMAVINFDASIPAEQANLKNVEAVMKTSAAIASDFVVAGAIPQSEAPSESPSSYPSVSSMPSYQPSISSMPSHQPSDLPSYQPSVSLMPSVYPTMTQSPSASPSAFPTTSTKPSASPTASAPPTVSQYPTPSPTARAVFEEGFTSRDIGSVGRAGGSSNPESGLHVVQGSGKDIYGYNDGFHYMYVETSGDVTVTALVENFSASRNWAKTGIMFRSSLSSASSHYSMFLTRSNGVANQYRTCTACSTYHAQSWLYAPTSVWLKVTKVGNVLTAYYRPATSTSDTWYQFGVSLSMVNIRSTGYYVGIAVTSRTKSGLATAEVSNIQLDRNCTSESITKRQCEQASNCEVGGVSNLCYFEGTMPSWEDGYPYDGAFVGSVLDVGSTVSSFSCDDVSTMEAVDGTTSKFQCNREGYAETDEPGIIAKPSHGQLSIVNGLRLYAPNDYPEGDPTEFTIQGRIISGSLVRDKWDNLCWTVAGSQVVPGSCDNSDPLKLFYQDPVTHQIRNVLSPTFCLTLDEVDIKLIECVSDNDRQRWPFNSESERFEMSTGTCIDYNYNTGYLWPHPCHGGANQRFYFQEETFLSGGDGSWEGIATGPLEMPVGRNYEGLSVTSDYESGDASKYFVEVDFLTNAAAYSEYRLIFQSPASTTKFQFAEIELRGFIIDLPFEETESHEGSGADYFNMNDGVTGYCRDAGIQFYDEVRPAYPGLILSADECADWCFKFVEYPVPLDGGLVGMSYSPKAQLCWCAFEGGKIPSNLQNDPPVAHSMTPGKATGDPVYHPFLFADVEASFTFEVSQEFKCYRRDKTQVGVYMQEYLNGANAPGLCHAESYNLVSIVKNFIKTDGAFSSFAVDESITSFADPELASKLASLSFFFMVDMEGTVNGWDATSQAILKEYVQNGGTLVMTGTYGNRDTTFLNQAFGWDLTNAYWGCSYSYRNVENTAGTPWDGEDVTLGCPSATQHISCNSVPCTPMWGTEASAAVVELPHGKGRVIYLGFDYYNTGYLVDGYHIDCYARNDPWVTVALRGSLLHAKSVSSAPEGETSTFR